MNFKPIQKDLKELLVIGNNCEEFSFPRPNPRRAQILYDLIHEELESF